MGLGPWGDKVAWNEEHFRLMGLTIKPGEITGQFFLDLVHPADQEYVGDAISEAIKKTGIYRSEFRIIRADNQKIRWMCGYGRLTPASESNRQRMIGVMYDVTDRKLLERYKDDLIAIASHELRTPVTSIKAYIQLLQRSYTLRPDSDEKDIVGRIAYQAERLVGLIRQLLDSSRVNEDQAVLHLQSFDFDEMVRRCIADIQLTVKDHLILFQPGGCGMIVADRQRIEQVCVNLLSNAVKFSPSGLPVNVATGKDGGEVWLKVRDRGPGIRKDMQEKIFECFFRINKTRLDQSMGTGLGLYISAGIIRQHKGKIGVDSEEGEGALFYFKLPLDQ